MLIRLMDLKVFEVCSKNNAYFLLLISCFFLFQWKPAMLDKVEKVLDAELKYTDEKKGVACKSM